ncbi:thioredoxin TrxC [Ramlibacter sp. AW1]|uniref:Thioredoxin TrxC n=1 Tax=Ramlibacter aurantiacus TaxID=2801330 RepID=A0A936ZFT1_9BURK|nr:thioredoxin TrxC [Ramlibacter aurantiacus]MBL0419473.1 thioredoxin TrxC [Ramlibacter aurantiacus]
MDDLTHVVCPHCQTLNRVRTAQLGSAPDCGRCKQALFTARPVELDAQGFDRTTGRGELPVLVDFWAPWCGPCRAMAPAYEQAAGLLEPQVRVAKVNTEDQPELAGRFNIRSIPTLALFVGGREVARQPGALTRAGDIVAWTRAQLPARA